MGGSYRENGIRVPCALDSSNGFVDILRGCWPEVPKLLIISSDPDNAEMNDSFKAIYNEAFKLTGLPLNKIEVCDSRNEIRLGGLLKEYNIVILAGGHVPTENGFFTRIKLKELLKGFDGIVIGISAGTMNCAELVYAQPELDGEALDPEYKRYIPGLGLTDINVFPHFQDLREITLDGLRILEDISFQDSYISPIYALNDGSYIFSENGSEVLYGEAYLISNGSMKQLCENGSSLALK
jgi:dipeptidase E